jgi:succinate dehydrogenase (ubiquinone) cytochrome b560 subunit
MLRRVSKNAIKSAETNNTIARAINDHFFWRDRGEYRSVSRAVVHENFLDFDYVQFGSGVDLRRSSSSSSTASTSSRSSIDRHRESSKRGMHATRALKIGVSGVPEEFGQPKTGGTSFLGTPKNHRELLNKRPLSPDVIDVDGKSVHYKFPIVALSSITNRVTGCVLSGAVGVGGVIACVGGAEAVPVTVEAFKSTFPMLVFPAKAFLSFPFVYHGFAGLRHVIWDMSVFGIDNENAKKSSIFVFASSIAGTFAMAGIQF